MIDYRRLGIEHGRTFARENISARHVRSEAQIDDWLADLWFRRIPAICEELRHAGAGERALIKYATGIRVGYAKAMRGFVQKLDRRRPYPGQSFGSVR